MTEKELHSYIKELEIALFLTSRDKVSWQVVEQIVNNNLSFDFKQKLLHNTNNLVMENNLNLKSEFEEVSSTTF